MRLFTSTRRTAAKAALASDVPAALTHLLPASYSTRPIGSKSDGERANQQRCIKQQRNIKTGTPAAISHSVPITQIDQPRSFNLADKIADMASKMDKVKIDEKVASSEATAGKRRVHYEDWMINSNVDSVLTKRIASVCQYRSHWHQLSFLFARSQTRLLPSGDAIASRDGCVW